MTTKKIIITVVVLFLAAGGGYYYWQSRDSQNTDGENVPFRPKAEENEITPPATAEEEQLSFPNLESSPKITIDNLQNGAKLSQGQSVTGQAQSSDGVLHILIKGSASGKLTAYSIEIGTGETARPYSFEVAFEKQPAAGEKGVLDIYTMQNGVRAYSTQIEVTF